jgi:flagellin
MAAESSLRDLDFAEESAEMARNQILFQAGTSVLASASTLPQTILELLK